jgi:sugar phosphate permease
MTAVRWRVFAASWLSYAGFYCTRKAYSVVKGPLKKALSTDDLGVAYLFTIYLVAYMLGQFLAAWLSRRMTNRRLLLIGMSTSVACNLAIGALLALGPSGAYGGIAVAMAIQGVAQATGWPCNVGLMAAWTSHSERGRVMAVWGTCYQVGAVVSKLLAAYLYGALGLAAAFWGGAVVLAIITVVFYVHVHESPEAAGLPALEPDPPAVVGGDASRVARQRMTLIISMGLIYFAFKFIRYALDSWGALIMSDRFGLSTEVAGYYSTTYDWIGFAGVLLAGWFSDRAGSRLRVIWLMTLALVGATFVLHASGMSSVPMFVLSLGLVGLASMGPDSLLSGAGAIDVGSRRAAATAAGIINGCGSAGPIVQEPLLGWTKTHYGGDGVMVVLVGISIAAAIAVTVFAWYVRRIGARI